jgi:hypothetical protein
MATAGGPVKSDMILTLGFDFQLAISETFWSHRIGSRTSPKASLGTVPPDGKVGKSIRTATDAPTAASFLRRNRTFGFGSVVAYLRTADVYESLDRRKASRHSVENLVSSSKMIESTSPDV